MKCKTSKGDPSLFGVVRKGNKTYFALHAPAVENVKIQIFQTPQDLKPCFTADMERTGSVWHLAIHQDLLEFCYTYLIFQNESTEEIFDPFNPFMTTPSKWGQQAYLKNMARSLIAAPFPFDWEEITHPNIPINELVIYEMHIRGFTKDHSSKVSAPGTFQGAMEKIPYLKELGVNAIELLPIQEFNESELETLHPKTGRALTNYWGYSTVNFFSPMNRYLVRSGDHVELKSFIKELHRNKIEVILDVVYNHTGGKAPFLILDPNYYILKGGHNTNYTGCGNTFSANSKVGLKLIIDSLRYLVTEFHVDGFRFDLASILIRSETGKPLTENIPFIEALKTDPILSKVKLISEPWDPGGLYQVGSFPLPFADWNGFFRDIARQYINSHSIDIGLVQNALKGSPNLFGHKTPSHSINFITVHDGFSLFDLVSYERKHNEENGEGNRDGTDCNYSNNFGAEGPNDSLYHLRRQQVYNFITFLFMSFGVPMILMGDEMGMTHLGNNNPWCQDSELNWFNWNRMDTDIVMFFQKMIAFRQSLSLFKANSYEELNSLYFHQTYSDRVLCYVIHSQKDQKKLCVMFNPTNSQHEVVLPQQELAWFLFMITSRSVHDNFKEGTALTHPSIHLPAYSSAILYSVLEST